MSTSTYVVDIKVGGRWIGDINIDNKGSIKKPRKTEGCYGRKFLLETLPLTVLALATRLKIKTRLQSVHILREAKIL